MTDGGTPSISAHDPVVKLISREHAIAVRSDHTQAYLILGVRQQQAVGNGKRSGIRWQIHCQGGFCLVVFQFEEVPDSRLLRVPT